MIFALIDLLEKLLGWLKPFAVKQEQATAQATAQAEAKPEAEPKSEPDPDDRPASRPGDDALRFMRLRPQVTPISEILAETSAESGATADGDQGRFSGDMSAREFMLTDVMPELPVITYLKMLMADKTVNRNPTVLKGVYLYNPETRIFGPVKADQQVWALMYFYYSDQYKFR